MQEGTAVSYQNFVLSFSDREGDQVTVRAVSSSGRRSETCTIPFDRLDRSFWRSAQEEPLPPGSPDSAKRTGDLLYRALFSGEIGQLLSKCLGRAGDEGGVRLVLRFDPEGEESLLKLPWETLFRHESNSFVALSSRTPVLRQIETPEHREPSPCLEHLRILVVVSDGGGSPLQLDHEKEEIQRVFADDPRVTVDILQPRNVQELREALQKQETHVLHYMGHGDFDSSAGEGSLYLGKVSLTGEELAQQLHDIKCLRLIFLNACHSARDRHRAKSNPFAGVAPALLRRGFPAVLAMSRAISDSAAIAFSQKFYKRLAAGDYLATAVSEGRLAICEIDRNAAQWATPILFTNHSDARLLPGPKPSPPRPFGAASFLPLTSLRWTLVSFIALALLTGAIYRLGSEPSFEPSQPKDAPVKTSQKQEGPPPEPTLILTEVFYNPAGLDPSLEWVEIHNLSNEIIDLAGYSICAGGETYGGTCFQLEGLIHPDQIFVIGGPKSLERNARPDFQLKLDFKGKLQNVTSKAADGVALFDVPASQVRHNTLPIDAVRYGPENRNELLDETGDTMEVEVSNAPKGASIERRTLSGKWRITSNPRPNQIDFEDE